MYTSRVHLAISTVYPVLCMVCVCMYDRWATLPTSAETTAVALWPWDHASERRRGEGGNGRQRRRRFAPVPPNRERREGRRETAVGQRPPVSGRDRGKGLGLVEVGYAGGIGP